MAVVFVRDITGRDGSRDVDSNKRYRRTWIVRTDNPVDGASVVLAAPGIPAFNAIYSYLNDLVVPNVTVTDPDAVAVDIKASQENSNDPQDWRVTVEYAGVADPVSQPADVDYSPTRYQKAIVKDIVGRPVVNSAGDPFEGGITVDRTRFTVTIARNVLTWDPRTADLYNDSLNQLPFLHLLYPPGFAAGTCKLNWSAKRVRRKGTASFFWHRVAVIDIDKEGWKVKVRDAGYNELVRDNSPTHNIIGDRKIMVSPGEYATSPWLLRPDGTKLPKGAAIPAPLEFDGYNVMDWSGLGIEYTETS